MKKAKKTKTIKVIPNGGYAKAGDCIRIWHKFKCKTEMSWMNNLPKGSWEEPGVLSNYMREIINKEKD